MKLSTGKIHILDTRPDEITYKMARFVFDLSNCTGTPGLPGPK